MEKKKRLTEAEKVALQEYLKLGHPELIEYLPCFYAKEETSFAGNTAVRLLRNLSYQLEEADENIQEQLYLILDKIMDGLATIRYKKDKTTFRFTSIDQINQELLKMFSIADKKDEFENFATLLNYKINSPKFYDECLQKTKELFEYYRKEKNLPRELTTNFYNQILNKQRDVYIKQEKSKMIDSLKRKIPYTKKKEESRIRGAKLKKIDQILEKEEFEKLGTSKEELMILVKDYKEYLNSLKKLKKEHIVINQTELDKINLLFIQGKLTEETLSSILPNVSREILTIVLDKYTQIKSRFLDNVSVTKKDLRSLDLGYNYNNYQIGNQNKIDENIIKIIDTITEEEAQDILCEGPVPQVLKYMLSLVGYFEDFDIPEMIGILRNYPRVLKQMKKEGLIQTSPIGEPRSAIMNRALKEAIPQFANFLTIMKAYDSIDDIGASILGKDLLEKLEESDRTTSKNPAEYLNVYQWMLKREYTTVPPIEGEFLDCYYETARDSDVDRLLIGKIYNMCCIGPGGGGEEAFLSSLTGRNADVIMIKKKETDQVIARSLCFRAGNYVVLAPIYSERGFAIDFYDPGFLSVVATKMLKKSQENNDTLKYVFISPEGWLVDDYYEIVEDTYLVDPFPHADLKDLAYLIGSTTGSKEVEIDSTVEMPVTYPTKREKIKDKSQITTEEITRIKALDIYFTEAVEEKETKARNFEEVNIEKYDELYKGQDWYIAMANGQIIEEIRLPIHQLAQEHEIHQLKNELAKIQMLTEDLNIDRGSSKGGTK